jgi:hypothetical protein
VLLPFSEGVGPRTVRLVLLAELPSGGGNTRAWVESSRVERPEPAPELSWYRAMHEATLLRWREGVHEGGAWLAQRGVEELALWSVGAILARGAGFFATEGLSLVTKALKRSPEAASGWLRTTLLRLPGKERKAFEYLWSKVQLEGEAALAQEERVALRGLMERIERLVVTPLGQDEKKNIREAARRYYKALHPELEKLMDEAPRRYPVHHRHPVEYAQLFPDEDINAAENLMLAQRSIHDRINALWTKFRVAHEGVTAQEVEEVARIIDKHLKAWCDRVGLPDELSPAFRDAEASALGELMRRFPALK